ncbi:ATP-dependent DNA helicase DDX11 [Polistes fuscatus]|uniref:ATP-dependent DNA helicase DDX11 n=1 Tax=Polistes fuscatus TaxID=30207 RepID=UPI001CA905D6|nr:ATP-dependent DNA helicase DDX11 [Polistes fuscatus]XP_043503573.1 ATP-dependent DNA helicase DDX11 [Polistes fuscatus]XP_043503574.1 ATP-dependent DNA helicase DDX11 [Polistes fuscatus]XP_043503575.1 ATP-dependent DNA helicase DDX11 [Polistes fuscatus]
METPEIFPFPFTPYKIQQEFMTELYKCIENGNMGIFESPTGTGKSLSVICGALKWLLDHEKLQKDELNSEITDLDNKIKMIEDTSNDWFSCQTEQMEFNLKKKELLSKLDAITKYEKKIQQYKEKVKKKNTKAKISYIKLKYNPYDTHIDDNVSTDSENDEIDKDLLLVDELSDSENSAEEEEEVEQQSFHTKIYFCSRTHSQLSQFVKELKRSPYSDNVAVVTLASRQNYCINKSVKKLKHINLINEHCLQLQKKKTTRKEEKHIKKLKVTNSCPFLSGNQESLMAELLSEIHDIEEIIQKGEELDACPYYTVRKSIQDGQLILVPYNSILHKNTRISSGINLKGNVLIIDEAHNLLDAIERMYSASITGRNILHAYNQLSQYQKKYQTLFNAKNVLHLNQLSFCLKKFLTVFGATTKSLPTDNISGDLTSKLYTIQEFERTTDIDTLNIFDLISFVKKSKLINKLRGFIEQYGNDIKIHENNKNKTGITEFLKSISNVNKEENVASTEVVQNEDETNSPLTLILSFLECLENNCADGRIIAIPGPTVGKGILKFLLLNPAAHFHDVVTEARAVILTGGTMEPISEFTEQLFLAAGVESERILTFSCDHVIPQENIISNILMSGPTGVEFEFNFKNRQNTKLLDELGRMLINFCNIIPAGIVIFLPSYDYENIVYEHLYKSGVITKIRLKKQIFREPKSTSQVSDVLEQYSRCINYPQSPQNGSLLFSVIGGKLSEGLNFSDDLGRCIIVIGMPYPNIKSMELQEKIKYLNENVKSDAGQNFYENSCMKAVNQCIGRAVRHINDYSSVILVDKRYRNKMEALPRWIQRSLTVSQSFGNTISMVAKFFAAKKKKI